MFILPEILLSRHSEDAFSSSSSRSSQHKRGLERRKGGGGGHGSSSHGSSSSSHSSPAKGKGASSAFTNSKASASFSVHTGKSSATPYSDGGGKSIKLATGSAFPGRTAGGSSRVSLNSAVTSAYSATIADFVNFRLQGTVYGTSRFGSGYPYGGSGYYVVDRPFPYYFYPTPLQYGYYGGDEVWRFLSIIYIHT